MHEDMFQKGNEMFFKKSTWNFVLNSKEIFVWGVLSGVFCPGILFMS